MRPLDTESSRGLTNWSQGYPVCLHLERPIRCRLLSTGLDSDPLPVLFFPIGGVSPLLGLEPVLFQREGTPPDCLHTF